MCGIVGILQFDPSAQVDRSRLMGMRDVLVHRGPDAEGLLLCGQLGFGHRRLSIIDVDGGHQPMPNADRTVWITYNGEVYNFKQLRAQLNTQGFPCHTNSDTEVILRAYEAFGDACVEHLRGMFAFAIWDARRGRLFMARDRLGIKPLYYSSSESELLFASEIKAILAAAVSRPDFNKAILPEFLANGFSATDETFFTGIHKLPPGHTLSWSRDGGTQLRRYWSPPVALDESPQSLAQWASGLGERLEDAVRSHIVSDVPVGLFLSGGIDSTALATLMAPMLNEPIRSFSVGYDDVDRNGNSYDELHYARLAAASVRAEHHEVRVSPARFFQALPQMIWHEDEPIAFPSSVSLYFVADLAARHQIKVVLSGEGADELLLGYNRYRFTDWNARLGQHYATMVPAVLRKRLAALLVKLPRSLRRYTERSFLTLDAGPRSLFYENFAVFPASLRLALVRDQELLAARDPFAVGLRCFAESQGGMLDRMAHADLQTYLVELLMKQDQMSMAASVESRVPFLDQTLVEYAAAMPAAFKLRHGQTKAVLREALRGRIPNAILTRKKMGFPTPVGHWLRGDFAPLCHEFVSGARALERGLFNAEIVRRLVDEHCRGIANHADRLWLLINLEIWQRIFIDGIHVDSQMGALHTRPGVAGVRRLPVLVNQ